MYIGHGRLCVCLSFAAFPHYCTDPDVSWGNDRVPSSCTPLGGLAIGARVRRYDNIAPNAKCQRVLVLPLCLVLHLDLKFGKTTFGYLVVTSAVFSLLSRAVHKFFQCHAYLSSIVAETFLFLLNKIQT